MIIPTPRNPLRSARLNSLALQAINDAGLQVPPIPQFELIMECAYAATSLHWISALREPSWSELDEVFKDSVVRAINIGPGVGDAASN